MTRGWRQVDFSEAVDFKEGPGIMARDFREQGVPLIRLAGVKAGADILAGCNYLDPDMVTKKWSHFRVAEGDVILSTSATLGEVARVPLNGVGAIPYTGLIRMRGRPELIDQDFLQWILKGPNFAAQVRAMGVGSVMNHFGPSHLNQMTLTLPPIDEQRRIAEVLGALDDLIEVNRELVENLLATVNVEFERRFGQRELSLRLDALASVIDCLHSKKPDRVTSRHRLLQLSNILDSGQLDVDDIYGISAEDYIRWTKNIETREWDCVITNVGRVGAVARIPAGVAAALGRNMTAIRPKAPEKDGAFILAALLSRPVRREITLKTDSGTVMDALNVKNIPSLRLPEASPGERSEFHAFARPLLQAADSLKNEITETQETRDELLPLLMSGRVRVAEGVAA